MAKALRATFPPGTVVLVSYDDKDTVETLRVETGEAGTVLDGVPLKVTVHRTEAIDGMMDAYRQLRAIPLREPPAGWFDQMRSLKRRTVLDTRGRARRVYVTTGTAGDDFAHAATYALVATELWRLRGGARAFPPREQSMPSEDLGFRRLNLSDGSDTYHPGFNERWS